MANTYVVTKTQVGLWTVTYASLLTAETGLSIDLPIDAPMRSVQISGTFGAGGTVDIQGSNDGSNWFAMWSSFAKADLTGVTAAVLSDMVQNCKFLRPRVNGGDGTTNIQVIFAAG